MQLLNAFLTSPQTLDQLKADSAGYVCQGSTYKLQMLQAQLIAQNLAGAVTAQPICWTLQELEGAITYVICKLLNQL